MKKQRQKCYHARTDPRKELIQWRELLLRVGKYDVELNSINNDVIFDDGCTALHVAARLNLLDLSKKLIKLGAKIEAKDDYGLTPLLTSASAASYDVLLHLLQAGANIYATSSSGLNLAEMLNIGLEVKIRQKNILG